jgi:hypothetical protein
MKLFDKFTGNSKEKNRSGFSKVEFDQIVRKAVVSSFIVKKK